MTSAYYQNELNKLRQLAVEFSKSHPALAPQLSGPSADPDVERILEGVAFLSGNIRQKLDDDFPEFIQGLMQLIYPHYLRPLPSATIIEFSPKSILKSELAIPAGTYIDSTEVEGTSCRFRTCYEVMMAPLFVTTANVEEQAGGRRTIELQFELRGMSLSNWNSDNIRFYIGGDYPGACDVYLMLQQNLNHISITVDGKEQITLPAESLHNMGFEQDEAMLSYPGNSFPAYRLLQEYYLLKEKFLFLELRDLQRWSNRPTSNRFTVKFHLEAMSFPMPRINKERFALHATPAINLFSHEAEPVLLDQRRSEISLRPRKASGDNYQIYLVNDIVGHSRKSGTKISYRPLGMFNPQGNTVPVYQLGFSQVAEGEYSEPHLSLSYPENYNIPQQETLTVKLTCTNGSLPSSLRPGDISRATSSTSELVEFRNILTPSANLPAPTGRGLLWRLLSHLSLNYLSVADIDNLKALLSLYIFSGSSNRKDELANRKRIDGILDIRVYAADRLVSGIMMRGQSIQLTVSRDHFAGYGDFYLFGSVVDHLFSSYASLNSYTETSLTEVNTGEHFKWPARLGNRPLI